jgi:hypothetical protein
LYWGHKWAKGQFYSFRSIGTRMVHRAAQNGMHELLNIMGCGLGYRSMFHLAADSAPVNVYRDMKHLPPQSEPVPYRFPYPPKSRLGFITDRWDKLRSRVQPRPSIR